MKALIMNLTLARGIEIFTALGRRTAKNWGVKQLTSAINMGLTTIATPEVLAAIKDQTIVADINAMLTGGEINIIEETPAAAPAPAAPAAPKAAGKKAPAAPAAKPAAAPAAPAAAPATAPKAAGKKAPTAPATAPAAAPAPAAPAPAAPKAAGKKKPAAPAAAPVAEAPAAPAAPVAEAPAAPAKGKGKKKAAEAAAPAAPAATEAPAAEAATEAPAAEAAAPASKAVGVRYAKGRPFVCGQKLGELGVTGGVTPELVAAVDEAYGDVNPRESTFALRNAWHAIRGYMGWIDAPTLAASHELAVEALPVLVGVRYGEVRPYCAGVILATHGLQNGVTEAMINAVEEMLPEDAKNARESAFALRNGWHALRGYFGVENEEQAIARDVERAQ